MTLFLNVTWSFIVIHFCIAYLMTLLLYYYIIKKISLWIMWGIARQKTHMLQHQHSSCLYVFIFWLERLCLFPVLCKNLKSPLTHGYLATTSEQTSEIETLALCFPLQPSPFHSTSLFLSRLLFLSLILWPLPVYWPLITLREKAKYFLSRILVFLHYLSVLRLLPCFARHLSDLRGTAQSHHIYVRVSCHFLTHIKSEMLPQARFFSLLSIFIPNGKEVYSGYLSSVIQTATTKLDIWSLLKLDEI